MRRRPTVAGPRPGWLRTLGLTIPAATLAAGIVLAGCAQPTAGTGGIGGTSNTVGGAGAVPTSTSTSTLTSTPSGSNALGTVPGSSVGSGPTTTATLSTCSPAPAVHTTVADDRPDEAWDEPMLTVTWTTNGWGAPQVSGASTIAVYPNGTVLAVVDSGTSTPSLPRVLRGELGDCRLAALIASADQLTGLDFGEPAITDQGMTSISYRTGEGVESNLSVYALGVGDEYVTDDQRSARMKLHGVLAGLRAAGDGAQQEFQPGRMTLRVVNTDGDNLRRLAWPGALGSLGADGGPECVVIDGDEAAAVRQALGEGPALARWSDGDRSVVLRASILLPGTVGCN